MVTLPVVIIPLPLPNFESSKTRAQFPNPNPQKWRKTNGASTISRSESSSARANSAKSISPEKSRYLYPSSLFSPPQNTSKTLISISNQSGYVVALKVIFKEKLEKYRFHAHLRREIEIQHGLNHPNVLRLFAWFHDDSRIFLVLEYAARGELYKFLKDLHHFSEKRAATVILTALKGFLFIYKPYIEV